MRRNCPSRCSSRWTIRTAPCWWPTRRWSSRPTRCALTAEDRAALALGKDGEPVLYCTLSVSADGWISANLLGPLAINPVTRAGRQLVLNESAYTTTTDCQVSTEAD